MSCHIAIVFLHLACQDWFAARLLLTAAKVQLDQFDSEAQHLCIPDAACPGTGKLSTK